MTLAATIFKNIKKSGFVDIRGADRLSGTISQGRRSSLAEDGKSSNLISWIFWG
jgi:hypothetical protein